jgi:hypothetical protein
MSKLFHNFFDSYRVRDNASMVVYIGKNSIGFIDFYPSKINPFMEDKALVQVYDNGEIWCDEHLAKLLAYTDSHSEFMEFCLDIWKNKTNKKLYPNCIIMSSGSGVVVDERIPHSSFISMDYIVQ